MLNFFKKAEPKINVEELITNAVAEYAANNHGNDPRGLREIFSRAISGQYDGADTLHNVFLDYGYPQNIDFFHLWNMYRRFGIAKTGIELPVDIGWSSTPEIKGDAAFNTQFETLATRVNLWIRLKGLDTRQRVGRYAGMFMRVKDGKKPDQPLEGTLGSEASLVGMTPLYESQLQVLTTEDDPTSENFGNPTMYQHNGSVVGDRNEKSAQSFSIHPSRVVIAAEGADDGSIYGIPVLESIFNSLMDLRKVIGGGAEGFYKNASQNIVFEIMEGTSSNIKPENIKTFNENFDDFSNNRMRKALLTPGLKPHVLQSDLINPKEFVGASLADISSGFKIAATILIGQQTGRLASDEDFKSLLAMVQSRRENFMTEMTKNIIDWFIRFGILPTSEFEIEWDDLRAATDKEKLENSEKLSTINKNQSQSGGDIPFTGDEIREAAGFDAEEMPDGSEIDDDDINDEDIENAA